MSQEDIARVLKKSQQAISKRINRALAKLAQHMVEFKGLKRTENPTTHRVISAREAAKARRTAS